MLIFILCLQFAKPLRWLEFSIEYQNIQQFTNISLSHFLVEGQHETLIGKKRGAVAKIMFVGSKNTSQF